MKKDDLIKSILSEAEDIEVPELSERARMEPIATLPAEVENRPRTKRNPFRALTLVVLLIMGFGFYYNTIMRPATKITIDINPSIELTLNSHDVVIGVSAFNDEGDKFLDQSNLLHKPLNMAIDDIVALACEMDYIKKGVDNAVLFSVKSIIPGKEAYHEDGLRINFSTAIKTNGMEGTFRYSDYTSDDEILASRCDVSPAKLAFIRSLLKEKYNRTYTTDEIPTRYFDLTVTQLVDELE